MTTINLDAYHKFIFSPGKGKICPFCQGTGIDWKYPICINCGGKGYVLEKRTVFANKCLSDNVTPNAILNYPDLNFLSTFRQNYLH